MPNSDLPAVTTAAGMRVLFADDDKGVRTLFVAPTARKVDLCCSGCGYGIVSDAPPTRCPMCGSDASWVESRGWSSRRAALPVERLAG